MNDNQNYSSMIQQMAATRPGSGFTKADGTIGYKPTAGETAMLGGFDKRMADLAAPVQPVAAPAPNTMAQGLANEGQSLVDSVRTNSNLSGRQKLATMGAVGDSMTALGATPDYGQVSNTSARQSAAFAAKTFGQDVARTRRSPILDAVSGYENGGKPGQFSEQHRRALLANRHHRRTGGYIEGPGTATSDSIPAEVSETGEPIRVANGERIVSVAQDQALERIAEMLGYESVDTMFEVLTGKPVGPTMKGGLPAAADGAKIDPESLMKQVASSRGLDYQAPAPVAVAAPVSAPAKSNLQMVGEESTKDINSVSSPGAKIHHAAKGVLAAIPAAAVDAYDFIAPKVAPIFTGEDYKSGGQPQPPAAPAPVQTAAPAPTPVVEQPGQNIMAAATAPRDFTPGHPLTTKDIAPGGYIDRGAGILAQRGKSGQLNVTNVGTGELTDPNKRAMDDSASALIDQKGSTYNPAAQLQRMQAMRMQSDASNPEVTDPNVRAAAVQGMNILNAARQGDVQVKHGALQEQLGQQQLEQGKQLAGLQRELLDPNTTAERRKVVQQTFAALHGREDKQVNLQAIDVEEPIDPKQPLLGAKKVAHVFDPRTGQSRPMMPAQSNHADVAAQARAAIARGADPQAVNARLKAMGMQEVK